MIKTHVVPGRSGGEDTGLSERRLTFAVGVVASLIGIAYYTFLQLSTSDELCFLFNRGDRGKEILPFAVSFPILLALLGILFILQILSEGLRLSSLGEGRTTLDRMSAFFWNAGFFGLASFFTAFVIGTPLAVVFVSNPDALVFPCLLGAVVILALWHPAQYLLAAWRRHRHKPPSPRWIRAIIWVALFAAGIALAEICLLFMKGAVGGAVVGLMGEVRAHPGVTPSPHWADPLTTALHWIVGLLFVFMALAVAALTSRLQHSFQLDDWDTALGRVGKAILIVIFTTTAFFSPTLVGAYFSDLMIEYQPVTPHVALIRIVPTGLVDLECAKNEDFDGWMKVEFNPIVAGGLEQQAAPYKGPFKYWQFSKSSSGRWELLYQFDPTQLPGGAPAYKANVSLCSYDSVFGHSLIERSVIFPRN